MFHPHFHEVHVTPMRAVKRLLIWCHFKLKAATHSQELCINFAIVRVVFFCVRFITHFADAFLSLIKKLFSHFARCLTQDMLQKFRKLF